MKTKGPTFPPSKIKRIIQQNQQVGKLSNVVPHLVQKSLQLFLSQVIDKINLIAQQNQLSKATPCLIRKAIEEMPKYQFMKYAVSQIQQFNVLLKKKKSQMKTEKIQRKKSSKEQIQGPETTTNNNNNNTGTQKRNKNKNIQDENKEDKMPQLEEFQQHDDDQF